jgi:hypothetical protein
MNTLEDRVAALEQQMSTLRSEMRSEVKQAAHELRDDSDFVRPYWVGGLSHMSDHAFTRVSRWAFWIILGSIGSVGLIYLGKLGVLFK